MPNRISHTFSVTGRTQRGDYEMDGLPPDGQFSMSAMADFDSREDFTQAHPQVRSAQHDADSRMCCAGPTKGTVLAFFRG
jgi:hypothetical protein